MVFVVYIYVSGIWISRKLVLTLCFVLSLQKVFFKYLLQPFVILYTCYHQIKCRTLATRLQWNSSTASSFASATGCTTSACSPVTRGTEPTVLSSSDANDALKAASSGAERLKLVCKSKVSFNKTCFNLFLFFFYMYKCIENIFLRWQHKVITNKSINTKLRF